MSDPFSIAAGVCGIISLASEVYKQGRQFLQECKDCPGVLKQLVVEINSLKGVLEALELLVDGTADAGLHAMENLGFANCREDLTAVSIALGKFELRWSKSAVLSNLRTTVKWPLYKEEIVDLIRRIERHKNTIQMAAMADNIHIALSQLENTKAVSKTVCDLRDDGLERRREERVAHRLKVLEWLSPYEHDVRHREISRKVKENTGQWFLNAPTFRKWLTGDDSPVLWCPGIPGSGKSCLTSIVIEHIQQSGILSRSDPKVALAYVYFDYKDRARQSPENVLAELIKQLEFQLVDTINDTPPLPHIEIMYQHLHNNGKRPALFDLKHSFHTISRQFEKIYLVFEALDECDEQTRSIVLFSLLEGLPFTPRGTNVFKLFVTARPYRANIQSSLGPEILQLPIAADMGDMELAARGKIAVAKQKGVIIYPQLEEDIVSAVLEKAAGMFLLANIHIDYILRQRTQKQKRQALGVIPKDLHSTYDRAMKIIEAQSEEERELALKALRWIVNAKRPLQWTELQIALSIQEGQSKLDEEDFLQTHDIVELCGSLVILDDLTQTIRLVHYTVQEFLSSVPSIQHEAHQMIAHTCLNYLLLDDFADGPCKTLRSFRSQISEKRFLDYSGRYWGYHCRVSGEAGELIDKALQLIYEPARLDVAFQVFHCPQDSNGAGYDRYQGLVHPMHAASVHGLPGVIIALLADGKYDVNVQDMSGRTPLHIAAELGHAATVRVLLEKLANTEVKNIQGKTVLHAIVVSGSKEIIQLLLENGVELEARNRNGKTAFSLLTSRGYNDIVQRSIEKCADTGEIYNGKPLIHLAARLGYDTAVRKLLKKGVDREARTTNGETPLHEAAKKGHKAVVQLLLEEGADTNAKNKHGETPLTVAQFPNNDSIFKLLQEKRRHARLNTNEPVATQSRVGYGWLTINAAAKWGVIEF